ncbi:uncharacterized protein BX663DRAFT_564110 [Cokeromyces recurvatus]|uniref:uncharacterized protein n=1 Tax=Cokeromyces recurvatus TaxID=90255 RepID=UPI00221EF4FE|nr:uncharacterized protein BX663DRAFT_564110 [Cokeromyces recurvatus]KAI7899297.1 hypothetical protein BX663DRAFT_564110 [Cokeromyces recurvatus]
MIYQRIYSIRFTTSLTTIRRRGLHMTNMTRSEGATANSKGFKEKETAVENQWARSHDAELLKTLKEKLATNEQTTEDLKRKLTELQSKK